MIAGNCKEKIWGKLPQLTSTEAKVANYVLDHYEAVLQYNVSVLAKKAGVSDATIVRFCRSIGYKGFQDFKMNAARDILPRAKQFDPILEQEDDSETVCNKIFTSEINVLNRTMLGLDMAVINKVVDKIYKARQVVIFGTGGSYIVARDAQHKFLKIGVKTMVYDDIDMQMMASSLMDKNDVAICISFSGSNYLSIECMQKAKSCGAYCVGIISQGKSPMSKIVNATIYSAYDETLFQSESVSTRIAQLAIIDAIVSNVAFKDYDGAYNAIQLTREATSQNKY
ncbi:MAG: MurR/RpiR family transcriptional regulator [Lachnospiraceae bacterium]|nr:MurR/RpiR family transcriptional regulator [Lachnospiraceae bacterium]